MYVCSYVSKYYQVDLFVVLWTSVHNSLLSLVRFHVALGINSGGALNTQQKVCRFV